MRRRPAGPVPAGLGLGLAVALVLAGCQGAGPGGGGGQGPGGGGGGPPTTQGGPPATAGRAAAPATTRPSCTDRSTRAAVRRYLAAFNAGRVTDLDEYFAPVPRFMGYGVLPPGGRVGGRARDRAGLLDYLRRRQARHERIELTWIGVTGDAVTYGTGNFALRGRRTADDLPGPQRLLGKGAIDCDTHKLIAVGIGRP